MDFSKILNAVKTGVSFAEELTPLLGLITDVPILGTAVKAVGAVTEVVDNIQTRIAEGKIVVSSDDQDEIRGMAERLSVVNDELAQYIKDS